MPGSATAGLRCTTGAEMHAHGAQAEMIAAKSGVKLPADFLAAAMASGLSETALLRYIDTQVPPMYVLEGYRHVACSLGT